MTWHYEQTWRVQDARIHHPPTCASNGWIWNECASLLRSHRWTMLIFVLIGLYAQSCYLSWSPLSPHLPHLWFAFDASAECIYQTSPFVALWYDQPLTSPFEYHGDAQTKFRFLCIAENLPFEAHDAEVNIPICVVLIQWYEFQTISQERERRESHKLHLVD